MNIIINPFIRQVYKNGERELASFNRLLRAVAVF